MVQLTLARWRMFVREPNSVFWAFGFPILLSVALGIAFRNRPPEPVLAAVESGAGAERLRAALDRSPNFRVSLLTADEARHALRAGKVTLVVVPGSPRGYRFDPTRPESRLARALVDDALQKSDGRIDPTPIADLTITEPGSRYIDFLLPGLIGMNLLSSGLWGVGYMLVEMRTRKLMKRLVATPMRRGHFLLSFLFMRMIFLLVELPLLLGFAYFVFAVPIRGSLSLLVALTLLGAFAFTGLGLLLGARVENTQSANGLINLAMLPMMMCSGVFFSSANFPAAMQPVIRVLPLTALNDALRAVMIEGAGIVALSREIVVLGVWGGVCFGLALWLFRWR